uniref:Small ribosomal subunit protein uS15m n=1 Tax=Crocodylus porosus TaxID=8502 RepID=A0A7M4E334_CROPO
MLGARLRGSDSRWRRPAVPLSRASTGSALDWPVLAQDGGTQAGRGRDVGGGAARDTAGAGLGRSARRGPAWQPPGAGRPGVRQAGPEESRVDDVVKKILSLEMAGQREKVKIKMEQLAEKVRRAPNDNGSSEVQVAYLTAKIRSYQEHLQKHPKDARNRRMMLMAIDQRKKILKYLRRTRYDVFENTCKQLDIEYTFPPPYCRKVTKLWLVKKAFCLQVFKEVQKLKAPERLKKRREWQEQARAAWAAREQAQQREGTPV